MKPKLIDSQINSHQNRMLCCCGPKKPGSQQEHERVVTHKTSDMLLSC